MRVSLRGGAVLLALVGLAGCATSVPRDAPQWYRAGAHERAGGYPNLRDVPRVTTANTDPAHWARVEADVTAAKDEMQANPRAQPAPPQDPNAFVNDARAAIDATRASHDD